MRRLYNSVRLGVLSAALLCLVMVAFHAQTSATVFDNVNLRYKHTLTGNIQLHAGFQSKFLPARRNLIVYLPPDYESNKTRRYPVLYMQDGQNVFDAATSFFAGRESHLDEAAETLIGQHEIEPVIIVGIYSSGLARVNEFTPSTSGPKGGVADLYGRMLVEEIKPFIDAHYRTNTTPDQTGLGGTSLGGLVTLYLGLKYKDVFGRLAVISPAAFWDNRMIERYVQSLPAKTNQRIFLAIGTAEPPEFLDSTRALHKAIINKGWQEGSDFAYLEVEGAQHSPSEHAIRIEQALRFLAPVPVDLPAKKPKA